MEYPVEPAWRMARGQFINNYGSSIFLDPDFQNFLVANSGQLDSLFSQALAQAQTNSTQSSLPIFSCNIPPVYDPMIPIFTQNVISSNLVCNNPGCFLNGYKTANQIQQTCALNIQNCLQKQGIQNLGQLNGPLQLQQLLTCTQSTSLTNPNNINTSSGVSGSTSSTTNTNTTTSNSSSPVTTGVTSSTGSGTSIPSTNATTATTSTSTTSSLKWYWYLLIGVGIIIFLFVLITLIRRSNKPKQQEIRQII